MENIFSILMSSAKVSFQFWWRKNTRLTSFGATGFTEPPPKQPHNRAPSAV